MEAGLTERRRVRLQPGVSRPTLQAMRAYLDVFSATPHAIKYFGNRIEIELSSQREVTLLEEQFPEFIEKGVEHSEQ
jgi:hypothetical protein